MHLERLGCWLIAAWLWHPALAGTSSPPFWVDERLCQGCHSTQHRDWHGSHHQRAMQPANPDTVLGDFSNHRFSSRNGSALFYQRGNEFRIRTSERNGEPADYRVAYTLGVEPLQQYLLQGPRGKLLAFNIAWDTVSHIWFELVDESDPDNLAAKDEPHENANFMCIECHASGFRRNYSAATDSYASSWHATGVGCQSCHGPAAEHVRWANQSERQTPDPIAQGVTRSNQIEVCGRCHSRRAALGDGNQHRHTLMDDYLPNVLTPILNEIDGKIRDEVFEYGSFLQSRMYAAGVVCSDCHQPHSGHLRQNGNALCTQCHNPQAKPAKPAVDGRNLQARNYDSPEHHRHAQAGPAAKCVSCHMPGRYYMGNDWRRDHSFGSPHPVQARELNHSDACLSCHPGLSAEQLGQRFASFSTRDGGYARALSRIRAGLPGAMRELQRQLARTDLASVRHATLLAELPRYPSPALEQLAVKSLNHGSAQVREMAIRMLGETAEPLLLRRVLEPRLSDAVRAVRISAAWQLLPQLSPAEQKEPRFQRALAEYEEVQLALAERPEANLNLAMLYAQTGRNDQVEKVLRNALSRDSHFTPAILTLAQWLEQQGRGNAADHLLYEALIASPGDADLNYAQAMRLIRLGKHPEALEHLRQAVEKASDNSNHFYAYGVALYQAGRTDEAMRLLETRLQVDPAHRYIRQALRLYARREGNYAKFQLLTDQLKDINPDDPFLQLRW